MPRPKKPKQTCTQIFIAALFIIAKIWKQWRYPLVVEKNNYGVSDNGILLNATKPWKDMEEAKMHIIKRKKTIWKGWILQSMKCYIL